ncbi:uncharacterized protein A1O9_09032 [Exophiala aquamarina CBS 119918]|uniref:DUF7721 domain-containing protein n=1 Tax=Exophiala aquamarina CBS 119918 TaxID=1182545 RepID=A0A072PG99_9EURO|nr:uncharacterized protein A1O9_09032 [Exophiala aquamarina CBS 119918]KEF54590.1 hypothetical protein A1O9_09032 [Exophiala aquamarina CBS 119918]
MSYDDDRRGNSGRPDPREYGGGGRGADNYYDETKNFDDNEQSVGYSRQGGGRDGNEYGSQGQENREGRGDEYYRRQENQEQYSGDQGGGYDNEPPRRHERRNDDQYGGSSGGYSEGRRHEGRQEQVSGGYGEERPYERRQNQSYVTSGHGSGGGGHPGGYGGSSADLDQEEILRQSQHGSSGNSDLFSSALSFLGNNKQSAQAEEIDEGRLHQSHQQLYQQDGGNQQHDASSLGAGAAMQALKMFSGGSGGSSGGSGSQSQSQMISMAMQEASKLFDKQNGQGNVQSGTDKQSVINQAAKYALQMYLKGGGGGGSGGLMSLASKFLT